MSVSINEITQKVTYELANRHSLQLDGDKVDDIYIGFRPYESNTSGSYLRPSYAPRVKIGEYVGRPTVFRPKKDGTFNYDKIADKIAEKYREKLRSIETEKQNIVKNNTYSEWISQALEKFNISEYSTDINIKKRHNRHYSRVYGIDLTIRIKSQEHLNQILETLQSQGLLETPNK